MLPGAVGSRWMPRKMAGIAMITIDVSIVAIVMLSVVLDSATHLYLPDARRCRQLCGSRRDIARAFHQPTAKRLLDGNYLSAGPRVPGPGSCLSRLRHRPGNALSAGERDGGWKCRWRKGGNAGYC